jgi:hypothetical protein
MVYTDKSFSENVYPKPNHDIDPSLKTGSWVCDNIKYWYNQYIAGNCGITPSDVLLLQELRQYLSGKQSTAKYRDILTREGNKSQQIAVEKRKAYHNINYNNLSSPMPKYGRKIEGMFMKEDHAIYATAVNEKSRVDKIESQIEKYIALQMQPLKDKIAALMGVQNPDIGISKFIERDMEEIQMLSNLGEYKLGYEVAAEKGLEVTFNLSDFKHIKRKIIRDLICITVAGIREVVEDNVIKLKYIDPENAIFPYDSENHFNDMEYFQYQEFWTIRDLRKKNIFNLSDTEVELAEKKLREIAQAHHKYNYPDKAFNFYESFYPSTGGYGYDDHVIPVMYGTFRSVDTKYRYTFKDPAGDTKIANGKWGVVRENTLIRSDEYVYSGYWIMGTEFHFDCGRLNFIPRNEGGKVRIPAHIVKLDGTSIMENAKPILDEYALLGYRLQNAWASAVPTQFAYDWSSLESITTSSGGKIDEFDLIRMHLHGQGIVYRSRPYDSQIKYPMSEPIKRLEGGLGINVLQEFITTEDLLDKKLSTVIGITSFETVGERQAVGVTRMAVASMSDVLKPLYDIYIESKERASYNVIYRLQLMLRHDNTGRVNEFYSNAIGKHYVEYLKAAYKKEPMSFGITFEAMATDEEKMRIKEWAARATAPGKNGQPILKASEYMFLTRNIDSPSGIKTFEIILRHREAQDELLAQQKQQAAIQAQGEQQQQQIMIAKVLEKVLSDAKMEGKLDEIIAKGNIDLRNELAVMGNQQAADAVMAGVQAQIQKYMEQPPQQQGQPQVEQQQQIQQ